MNRSDRGDDIDASDTVMIKADALIHRHRAASVDPADDLPLLQDIVGEELPVLEDIVALTPDADEDPLATLLSPSTPETALTALRQELEAAFAAQCAEVEARAAEAVAQADAARAAAAAAQAEAEAARTQLAQSQAAALAIQAQVAHTQAQTQAAHLMVAERLIDLDAFVAQTLEAWMNNELPQVVAAELDGMVERLRMKTLAHMRATLMPELSEKLSEILDATLSDDKPA